MQKGHPHRECGYMGVVGTHAGKCRECRCMVLETVPLVQKNHPYREMNPHNECRECRYIVVVGAEAGKYRECWYMVVGTVPLVQKGHPCRKLNSHRETEPL